MDYKDLADLIFPDAKPREFYEEKYPERDLPEGAMVVRIGPSPTGSVHIGTIYQALLARTIADNITTAIGVIFFTNHLLLLITLLLVLLNFLS